MKKSDTSSILAWDLSLRVFHWLFAGSISAALLLAIAGEHSSLFVWHQIFGICAAFLLVVRVVIGIVGSKHARLGALFSAPMRIGRFLADAAQGKLTREGGHNPAASIIYLVMFTLLTLTVVTGLNMNNELAEESHEFFAYSLLATIGIHLAGIVIHTIRARENIALAMVTGRKQGPAEDDISGHRPALGVGMLAVSLLFIGKLFASYDQANSTVTLPLVGKTIALGEGEENESERGEHGHEHDDDDD